MTTVPKLSVCLDLMEVNNELLERVKYGMETAHEYISKYYAWNIVCKQNTHKTNYKNRENYVIIIIIIDAGVGQSV